MNDFLPQQFFAQTSTDSGPGAGPMILAILGVIGLYCLYSYVMYKTALRCGAENPWYQFVPILNIYSLVVEMAKLEWWYIILVFIPLVNIVAGMYILYRVVENAGRKYSHIICLHIGFESRI